MFFRCASISWFQVVSEWVIDIFLQLAHLRVFQIILQHLLQSIATALTARRSGRRRSWKGRNPLPASTLLLPSPRKSIAVRSAFQSSAFYIHYLWQSCKYHSYHNLAQSQDIKKDNAAFLIIFRYWEAISINHAWRYLSSCLYPKYQDLVSVHFC